MRQGMALDAGDIARILNCLADTDMTIPEIAERMGCSRTAVAAINRRHGIRDYAGRRSMWTVRKAG
jgi:hypothetical protein